MTFIGEFEDLRIVDNFYQTSSYFPMPVVAITTLTEDGNTNVGPYSLVFPYYIAGKEYYAMVLEARNNSNTAMNIIRNKKCVLNFLPDDKKYMKECVRLGFPGDTTSEKMEKCMFTLQEGMKSSLNSEITYPKVISESFQAFECTWMAELEGADKFKVEEEYLPPFNDFNGITSKFGAHFILRIDKILMKSKYRKGIIDGVKQKTFPQVPIDYGYRDNTNFWISNFKAPYAEGIPKVKGMELSTVQYAADRIDPDIKFTKEASATLVKIPRIFLKTALKGCVEWAQKNNVSLIDVEHMEQIRDKRSSEKKK